MNLLASFLSCDSLYIRDAQVLLPIWHPSKQNTVYKYVTTFLTVPSDSPPVQICKEILHQDSEKPWDSHHFLIREELLSHPPFKTAEGRKNIEKEEQKERGKTLSLAFLKEATTVLTTKLMSMMMITKIMLWTWSHESYLLLVLLLLLFYQQMYKIIPEYSGFFVLAGIISLP